MKKIIFILFLFLFTSCDDKKTAQKVLEDNGYTEIVLTGYAINCCSDSDDFSTEFKAKSPSGKEVSGCVCSSYFSKGATIRFK